MNDKKRVVSGIQPSGEMHIGNYLGALKNFVKMQEENYDCFFFIADYHSMTVNYETNNKTKQSFNLVLDYLASGLDPEKSTIYMQSDVPMCTELAWIFNTITPVAELERMTQFKDKTQKNKSNINVGLLDYPVLMAADILLYKADFVPVGQDQFQHLELTRKIAKLFNNRFGDFFKQPKEIITQTPKIMSLADPTKKMSKSHGPKSYIGINDEPEVIEKKIKKAVSTTDYNEEIYDFYYTLLQEFGTEKNKEYFEEQFKNKEIKFSEIKKVLIEDISNYFKDFREKRKKLENDPALIKEVLKKGAEKAQDKAEKNMLEIKKKIGII